MRSMIKDKHLEIDRIKGFLRRDEGIHLYELAREGGKIGPCLEIGSYCGKSTAYLGLGCREAQTLLYTIDHHRGSEEQQPGETYFDTDLYDAKTGKIDTLPFLRKTVSDLSLEDTVVIIVAPSTLAARFWRTPLGMVFIDGSHSFASVYGDYAAWSPHLLPGGYLVFHDIYEDPAAGGQAPFAVYQMALASGLFEETPRTGTLGVLKKAEEGKTPERAEFYRRRYPY